MRKTVLLVAALVLLLGLAGAVSAGSVENLYSNTVEGCTLDIQRMYSEDTGRWTWSFTVSLAEDAGPTAVVHEFFVGLANTSVASHISDLTSTNGASGKVGAESVLWTFDGGAINPGEFATFTFTTDLNSVTDAIHSAVDGDYEAYFNPAPTPAATPEPGTMAMLATGVTGLLGAAIRKRK